MSQLKLALLISALLLTASCGNKDYIYYKSKCAGCDPITNFADIQKA